MPCPLGQYCPANTTNVNRMQAYLNVCPPGYNCNTPSHMEVCPKGRYCRLGTYFGGEVCSSEKLRAGYQEWAQAIYCPAGSQPNENDPFHFLCPAGYYCPNASAQLICPAGSWCPTGVNASTPCRGAPILGRTANERCPDGSRYEPAWQEHLVYLGAIFLAILFFLEVCTSRLLTACEIWRRTLCTEACILSFTAAGVGASRKAWAPSQISRSRSLSDDQCNVLRHNS